ncbi:hypothetical protein B0H12DRAFT_303655 [Mycena haematopus]|nr:hypothetical protein B0H12DRAFT_303655 [Mycena haematopus]
MHRCLEIPEVVSWICCIIKDHREAFSESEALATLAALARTCKMLSSPALDILWRDSPSLANILRCMPDDLWSGLETGDFHLRRPAVNSDWERLLVYSHRVRLFGFSDKRRGSSESLNTLRVCFPGQHLFPNIQKLVWSVDNPDEFPHVSLFLGPRLTTLLLGSFSTTAHLSFLATVVTQCPSLAEVHLKFYDPTIGRVDQLRTLSCFVQGLRLLKTLSVPSLDLATLHYIARLPGFVSLTLTSQIPLSIAGSSTSPSGDPLFTTLKSLNLGPSIDVCSEMITLLGDAPIVNIHMPFISNTSSAIAQFYVTLAASCSHSSLSVLQLGHTVQRRLRGTSPADQISGSQMRPLFSFSNITSITLAAPGFDLDDATIADMARAWPRIEKLELIPGDLTVISSTCTLGGLLPLARHCPRLSALQLALNATAVPDLQSMHTENERVRQLHLDTLHIFCSRTSAPVAVALFLSSVFPRVQRVTCDHPAHRREYEMWNEVSRVLSTLHAARVDEEYWAARAKDP